jgi:hypothetical protein
LKIEIDYTIDFPAIIAFWGFFSIFNLAHFPGFLWLSVKLGDVLRALHNRDMNGGNQNAMP